MVGLGMFFIAITMYAMFLRWRGTLFEKRWLMWVFVVSIPLPYIANQVGWATAEVGRQPWIVYNLLRTSDALSKSVSASQTLGSIIMFGVIYILLFLVWLYVLNDKIHHGPEPVHPTDSTGLAALADVAGLRAGTGASSLTMPGQMPKATSKRPPEPGQSSDERDLRDQS
jgi:cytochrome bd-type quinol oxidase subunit 1